MSANNKYCGVGVAYNSKIGGTKNTKESFTILIKSKPGKPLEVVTGKHKHTKASKLGKRLYRSPIFCL